MGDQEAVMDAQPKKRFTIYRPSGNGWVVYATTDNPGIARAYFLDVKATFGDAFIVSDPPTWNVEEISDLF
jgi:hypothetical protein